mmetsp:Transcript_114130/g.362838  ORF Transcript_114130/g.362838 Transcript_114130/m.362838 type:complete len:80 (-) Transcript_114130:144-383(-)
MQCVGPCLKSCKPLYSFRRRRWSISERGEAFALIVTHGQESAVISCPVHGGSGLHHSCLECRLCSNNELAHGLEGSGHA